MLRYVQLSGEFTYYHQIQVLRALPQFANIKTCIFDQDWRLLSLIALYNFSSHLGLCSQFSPCTTTTIMTETMVFKVIVKGKFVLVIAVTAKSDSWQRELTCLFKSTRVQWLGWQTMCKHFCFKILCYRKTPKFLCKTETKQGSLHYYDRGHHHQSKINKITMQDFIYIGRSRYLE